MKPIVFLDIWPHHVALAGLKLNYIDQTVFKLTVIHLPLYLPSAGINGMYHHTWPKAS